MDLKAVIETGSEALAEQVDKVTSSISPGLANIVETPIGKQIASIVSTAGAKAEQKLEQKLGSGEQEEAAATAAPPEGLDSPAADLTAAAAAAADSSESGSRKTLVIGAAIVLLGATAAGAVIYRRRRAGQAEDVEEGAESAGAVVTPITAVSPDDSAGADQGDETAEQAQPGSGSAEEKSEATDQSAAAASGYAAELDAEAEHFVQDFVDHIDDEEELLDPDLAVEIDAEADHFAQELVDQIEVTDEPLPEER